MVGELLIISVLSILFNTYNLTNVYSKANATVQNSSDLRSIRKILEKTLENSQKRAKIVKIKHKIPSEIFNFLKFTFKILLIDKTPHPAEEN